MAPSIGRVLYRVKQTADGVYELEAGEIHGITAGAKFNIYATKDPDSKCLGVMVAAATDKPSAVTTVLRLDDGSSPIPSEPSTKYALQVLVGEQQDLRVFIEPDTRLLDVFVLLNANMKKSQEQGKRGFKPAEQDETPDLRVVMKGDKVEFGITDSVCVSRGMTTTGWPVDCDASAIFPVLTSAADFYFHLRRTSSQKVLSKMVDLECYELEETDDFTEDLDPLLAATGESLVKQGVIDVEIGKNPLTYGYKIVNRSNLPLYAALFYFSMGDLSIGESTC